ncbi:hypothetical protein NIES37_21610 [Tolypothrix tenuis PCC 7101]|uniref:Uncharacterized protein n=1 Tax=Tolypothrix tenuis PCC 7101 TaxID=231146 RepID=A0A1Z4MXN2_9CYAN|nr:hypothetical protein NIES37_21610 [Tolypothrix tenuis PCC 7101]BAZ77868.1 hypothetical protein NIES50_65010 [Aulosira laxa NIES-50]
MQVIFNMQQIIKFLNYRGIGGWGLGKATGQGAGGEIINDKHQLPITHYPLPNPYSRHLAFNLVDFF